jgi:drug/metabolite transporter (DMT)-like permease
LTIIINFCIIEQKELDMNMIVSKKLLMAILGVVAVLLEDFVGLQLSDAQMTSIAAVVVAYLAGQSYVDGKPRSEDKK